MIEAVVLAFALAMDATAVAAARGLSNRERARREALVLPMLFGGFQAAMTALGWALGAWGGKYVVAWDHWVAFVLLAGIGGKMVIDTLRDVRGGDGAPAEAPDPPERSPLALYLLLALATSIDAAAAGITLPLLAVAPVVAIALIGCITWACSLAGYYLGRALGGPKLGLIGGCVLIAIGTKILVEHL